jgi:site-specific recombinase XerD
MSNITSETLLSSNPLGKYDTVVRWLRDKKPKTIDMYLRSLGRFSERSGMNPDQILDWAKRSDSSIINDTISKYADDLSEGMGFNLKIDMRSYLKHHGVNNLGKSKIEYTLQDWHRGYRPEEIKNVLSYLDSPVHKLYVLIAIETGFRANTILALKYKHVQEDLDANVTPCAIRLEPKFYQGKKAAGFAFLGQRSLTLLKQCIKNKQVSTEPDAFIFAGRSAGEPSSYAAFYDAISLARKKAGVDPKVQPNHGLRKFFENALDQSGIDHEYKMMIEGHFIGARGKHYTAREWGTLRPVYQQAYPHLDVEGSNPELEKKLVGWDKEKTDLLAEMADLKATVAGLVKQIKGKKD